MVGETSFDRGGWLPPVDVHWPVGERQDCVCDWGVIDYPQARPDRDEVGSLVLVPCEFIGRLLTDGPQRRPGGVFSASFTLGSAGGRTFVHLAYEGRRWTWEVFPARFYKLDDAGEIMSGQMNQFYVGRWPD